MLCADRICGGTFLRLLMQGIYWIEKIECAIDEFDKKARGGFFERKTVMPMITVLGRIVDKSPIKKQGNVICNRLQTKVDKLLNEAPVILEDFNSYLYGNKKSLRSLCEKWRRDSFKKASER
jgi:hypothetical protein